MFTQQLAKMILVPYLWWFGYEFDSDSLKECHESIDLQYNEQQKKYRY